MPVNLPRALLCRSGRGQREAERQTHQRTQPKHGQLQISCPSLTCALAALCCQLLDRHAAADARAALNHGPAAVQSNTVQCNMSTKDMTVDLQFSTRWLFKGSVSTLHHCPASRDMPHAVLLTHTIPIFSPPTQPRTHARTHARTHPHPHTHTHALCPLSTHKHISNWLARCHETVTREPNIHDAHNRTPQTPPTPMLPPPPSRQVERTCTLPHRGTLMAGSS